MKKIITSFVAGLLVATTSIGVLATNETFTLTKSETPIYVNGVQYPSDALPILNLDIDGKGNTYVPLRNLSEMLGADVNWNNETKAIDITTDDNVEFATKPMPKPSNADLVVTSITSPINTNEIATLSAVGTPNTQYSISVYYGSGPSSASGLEDAISDNNGNVSWSWKIGGKTNPGSYRIVLTSSDGTQKLETSITIQ